MKIQVPDHYDPRAYQREAIQALKSGVVLAVLCWARRAGKDLTSFSYAVEQMVERPINVVLVFPNKEQGRTAFWENVENDGYKTINRIPEALISRKDNTAMRLTLKNGSTFQVLGSDNPDALRGANGRIYILSEFVDIPVSVINIIRPVVAVNGGQIILISTPKIDGISGASFKRYFDRAMENWTSGKKTQYASLVTAREYLSDEALEELRQENIAEHGNDFFFRQEFLCDFGQTSASSYYGAALTAARKSGRIGRHAFDPAYPVYTAWDLGVRDSTSVVFFQVIDGLPKVVDYFETSDIGNQSIASIVLSKPYSYGWHFFPHDGSVRESDAVTRIRKYQELGISPSSLLTRESKDVGIARAVERISKTEFNEPMVSDLLRKLSLYKRKYNPHTGDYVGPEHKTESHAADCVRYMYKALEQFFDAAGRFIFASGGVQEDYETDGLSVAGF